MVETTPVGWLNQHRIELEPPDSEIARDVRSWLLLKNSVETIAAG